MTGNGNVTRDGASYRPQLQAALGSAYELGRELGGGGMSRVFVAHDRSLGRDVVVKLLLPELAAGVSADRFRREIALVARLQHPNIVAVLSAGDAEGLPYFTMPFIRGESLRALLKRSERLAIRDAVRILRDIASALACAHEESVVHRDIKPDNVLLSGGSAMVTDFGVAKALSSARDRTTAPNSTLTVVGTSLGTPEYMAPEQASADPTTDHRADIYSFGVTAYEMLAGCLPFQCDSQRAAITAHLIEKPAPIQSLRPDIPDALASLVMGCLEKDPADRPQTAKDLVSALDALGGHHEARGPLPRESGATVRARRWPWVAGVAGVAAAVVLALAALRFGKPAVNAVAAGPVRLAVLPFSTEGSAEDRYFADGLSEAISNRLAGLSGLAVVDRKAAGNGADSGGSLTAIAKKLDVQYLLTGTVRWERGSQERRRAQVMAALVRASDGTTAWAPEPYIVTPTDAFQVQTEIATRVAEALDVALAAPERRALAHTPTDNPEAYDAYLHGLDYFRRARDANFDAALLRRAIDAYESAVAADKDFALAYAKLAEARFWWASLDPSDAGREAAFRAALDRAMRLDPTLPEVRAAQALEMDH